MSNTNITTQQTLSEEMREFYGDYLIDNAEPKMVHDQFGQKCPIPKNGGKTITFRRYDPLPKALTELEEGVTPDGQVLSVEAVEATVAQYGGYVEMSDILLLTAVDNNLVMATKLLGSQAGRTLDTITREVLNGGSNVQYGEQSVDARHLLVGGSDKASDNHYLTVNAIRRAVRTLKNMNADTINGSYVGIIHPDVAFDLKNDPAWANVKTYCDPQGIYEGEIGRIEGVRFVETTEAKIFHAEDLCSASRNLSVGSVSGSVITLKDAITAQDAGKLPGRKVLIGENVYTVASATENSLTVEGELTAAPSAGDIIYPGEAGSMGRDVYSTLILGDNAYGVTEITGGGLQHIIKQLGSAGTADPLSQRASCGWKATKVAARLVEAFMVRIETASTFQSGAN
ncbi:MAG: N4-gp56 family major capsid protein [Oscillospiraceae bacterium]|nr:N4-gp56 family major capsid protein [Oscillospiraceae bacterium]